MYKSFMYYLSDYIGKRSKNKENVDDNIIRQFYTLKFIISSYMNLVNECYENLLNKKI